MDLIPSRSYDGRAGSAFVLGRHDQGASGRPRSLVPAALLGLVLLIGSGAVAAFERASLDYPAVLFLNRFAGRSPAIDAAVSALTRLDLLKGVFLVAGICFVWFAAPELESRARLVAGLAGASAAGLLSRMLQLTLPTHPRPLHDPALHFVPPAWVHVETLNNWDSFPSDHASLLFALAMTIYVVRPALGILAFAWAVILNMARIYCGFHFPSDVAGGIGLGIMLVCVSQLAPFRRACSAVARWADQRAPSFYAVAFIIAYLIATLFDDVRSLGKGVEKLLPYHRHAAELGIPEYPITMAAARPAAPVFALMPDGRLLPAPGHGAPG